MYLIKDLESFSFKRRRKINKTQAQVIPKLLSLIHINIALKFQ